MKKTEAGKKQPWTLCSRLIQINSERRWTAVQIMAIPQAMMSY